MTGIAPTKEQFFTLKNWPDEGPVVMLNLLKFRDQAQYEPGVEEASCSGKEAYGRYSEGFAHLVPQTRAEVLVKAKADQVVIGADDEEWDEVIFVRYPSRKHFIDMQFIPEYQALLYHRTAGLERTRLIACSMET